MPESKDNELMMTPTPVPGASLPGPRRAALELILGGKSIAETARAAGVSRTTVYSWLRNDPVFRAAYNQWHEEMEQSARSRLLMLTDQATEAVRGALEGGDAKTAMQLLKGLGILSQSPPRLTEAQEVKEQEELETKRRQVQRECETRRLDTDKAAAEVEYEAWSGGKAKVTLKSS
jgi:AcrR family transcriptional regulator